MLRDRARDFESRIASEYGAMSDIILDIDFTSHTKESFERNVLLQWQCTFITKEET
jgi:hypothetical protein